MRQEWLIMLMIGMVVVGLIFAPPAIESALGGLRDIFETFRETWFKDWGAGLGGSQTALGWEIHYDDGTTETFNPNDTPPLTVLYEDKAIQYFGVVLWFKIEYSKEISRFEGSGETDLWIKGAEDAEHWRSDSTHTTIPNSGEWTKFFGSGISFMVKNLEEFDAGRFDTYIIEGIGSLTIVLEFEDGTTQTLSGDATGSITLNVVQSATLDVEVRGVALSSLPTNLT